MKKIFKLVFLLNALIPLILTVCPDYPTIPTTSPKLITRDSDGISHFPTSTQQLSITMFITPDEGCTGTFNLFSMDITPPGETTQQYVTIYVECSTLKVSFKSNWFTELKLEIYSPGPFGPLAVFVAFDLSSSKIGFEFQTESYKDRFGRTSTTSTTSLNFDSNSKFYLCADKDGVSSQACTVSKLIFEYRNYLDLTPPTPFGHLSGAEPAISAFYPLFGGSLASIVGSSSAYLGDKESNPTPGTIPTWDSSNNLVTISSGQFITLPLPSVSSTIPTVSYSFSVSAWIKFTGLSSSQTNIFSMYSSTGSQVGYRLQVGPGSNYIGLGQGGTTNTFGTAGGPISPSLNTWQLIGFTLYSNTNQERAAGTIFYGTSLLYTNNGGTDVDLPSASVIRIGDATNSFSGQVSLVRIITPTEGIVRATDTCWSDNSLELGVGPFALACSGTNVLNLADNKCYSSCPAQTAEVSETAVPICVPCSDNCASCDTSTCLTCETDYFVYQGGCVKPCPDKTYSDGTACQSCADTNCKQCDSTQCLTCETDYFVYQGGCVKPCPDKTYSDGTACQSCADTNCKQCDSTQCLTCDTGYLKYEGGCVKPCPDKTYSDGTACQSCSDTNCKECDSTKCLTCDTNFFLYQGSCVAPCPSKTYSVGTACKDCSTHCKVCDDSTKCKTCDLSYLLYQDGCVDSCPAKFYSDGTSCIACSDHCNECDASGCKVCGDGYESDTENKCALISSPPSPSTPQTEEAGSSGGGISGGALAGIICGSVAVASLVGWSIYSFNTKKFPFAPKRTDKNPYKIEKKDSSTIKPSNPVSPVYTEDNPLFP